VIDDFLGCVRMGQARRRFAHRTESARRCHEFGNGLGECGWIEGACFEATCGARRFQGSRIRSLMIIGCEGVGHEECGHAGQSQFCHGQRARSTNREVRPSVSLRHVDFECHDLCGNAEFCITRGYGFPVGFPRLVKDFDTIPGETSECFRNILVQLSCALASAEHEQA